MSNEPTARAPAASSPVEGVDVERAKFERDGFVVVRRLASAEVLDGLKASIDEALDPLVGPAEFEVDVGYPGAPSTRDDPGGATPRRLLNALARGRRFRDWALKPAIGDRLRAFLGSDSVALSQCHHNCVMTKHPGYSSLTMWHQDQRYWSFDRPELTSVWLALGSEDPRNGALHVIPGSHLEAIDRGRLDRDLFLRPELAANERMIARAKVVELEAGDVLFFHSRLFHAAGRNQTDAVKLSLVFTYHSDDNRPIPGTRSSRYPSIGVPTSGSNG